MSAALRTAIGQHRPGHALPRAFAVDPKIHEHELETIWRSSWPFAGAGRRRVARATSSGSIWRPAIR
jgi:hypothetical protein